jgi:hypothetical protein
MLTDGISEVPNERDEEFGLARLEQLLTQCAAQPLPQIWELIMEEVRQHVLHLSSSWRRQGQGCCSVGVVKCLPMSELAEREGLTACV